MKYMEFYFMFKMRVKFEIGIEAFCWMGWVYILEYNTSNKLMKKFNENLFKKLNH